MEQGAMLTGCHEPRVFAAFDDTFDQVFDGGEMRLAEENRVLA